MYVFYNHVTLYKLYKVSEYVLKKVRAKLKKRRCTKIHYK
jgi:hypothetical protein